MRQLGNQRHPDGQLAFHRTVSVTGSSRVEQGKPQTSALSPAASLNQSQLDAIASAVGRDTTFIWDLLAQERHQRLAKIGNQLARLGRSVLMVSHTNSAVDQAIIHIADALGSNLKDGSILRLGVPHDLRLLQRPRLLAQTHIDERSEQLAAEREELRNLREQHEARGVAASNGRRRLLPGQRSPRRRQEIEVLLNRPEVGVGRSLPYDEPEVVCLTGGNVGPRTRRASDGRARRRIGAGAAGL